MEPVPETALRDMILGLCRQRGPGKSICPSEAARRLWKTEADWRAAMPRVRKTAFALAAEGRVLILQKGKQVTDSAVRGPIRIRICGASG